MARLLASYPSFVATCKSVVVKKENEKLRCSIRGKSSFAGSSQLLSVMVA